MAKTGFWLRGAKGKLAGATIYQSNGKTQMREITAPKNPQTDAQLIQRAIMATVMKAYGAMKEITDHSFEGTTAGSATMARFQSLNAKAVRARIEEDINNGYDLGSIYAFSKIGDAQFVPNAYVISAGSLPSVVAQIAGTSLGKITVGAAAAVSYQDIINFYGLQRGDQLTFVELKGTNYTNIKFHFARVILDPTDAQGNQAPLTSEFVKDGAINLPSPRNEGSFGTLTGNKDIEFSVGPSNVVTQAVGVIVSRKVGETWQRSACQLAIDPANSSLFPSLKQAMDSAAGTLNVLNNRYLNNAGEGAVANGANAGGLTFTTLGGKEIVITGCTINGDGLAILNDAQGKLYYLKGNNMRSAQFGKYIGTTNTDKAPEDATNDNTVGTQPTLMKEDGTFTDNVAWAIERGIPIANL